jgi:hypothetical protein
MPRCGIIVIKPYVIWFGYAILKKSTLCILCHGFIVGLLLLMTSRKMGAGALSITTSAHLPPFVSGLGPIVICHMTQTRGSTTLCHETWRPALSLRASAWLYLDHTTKHQGRAQELGAYPQFLIQKVGFCYSLVDF